MRPTETRTRRPEFEAAAIRIETLFRRHPQLSGFMLDAQLCIEDVALDSSWLAVLAVGGEIAQAMHELLDEAPAAADWLRGRTFVRTLH